MRNFVLLFLILGLCALSVNGIRKDELYPFGSNQGDARLPIGDDISSQEIPLQVPIAFYDNYYQSIFINLNGHLSFETDLPAYQSDLIIPFGFKVIAPFLADIDSRLSGNVYYRETQDPSLLDTASRDIITLFPDSRGFRATSLIVVTWDDVGYYSEQYDKTNTFQVVIASDGSESFACFHYPEGGINWVASQGKFALVAPDVPAQAGFDAGDFRRSTTLPASGQPEVKNLVSWSNVNKAGVWLYKIGMTDGANIEGPPQPGPDTPDTPGGGTGGTPGHQTCAQAGQRTCHGSARCTDNDRGFCCECLEPFFGNGVNCVERGTPQRINGKVSGNINGVQIEEVDLHAYVVTADGRSYTAISRLPLQIGFSFQSLFSIGNVVGWLFAMPSPGSKNGFMITGGDFNRTAMITFVSTGETVTIKQYFVGQDALGYMRMMTTINGNVPYIGQGSKMTLEDHTEDFRRVSSGVMQSYTTHTYAVDGVPLRFTLDQTILYKECEGRPLNDVKTITLAVNRNFISFDANEQIVRYASTSKITEGQGEVDICRDYGLFCDSNADCVPGGAGYTCECRRGFQGDGQRCEDIDECLQGIHNCDQNARCVNSAGNFQCSCNPGFEGDGVTCRQDLRCGNVICDVHARCVFDPQNGIDRCECSSGWAGDGQVCREVAFSCNEVNKCDENAECVYDPIYYRYQCECNDGFSGDGYYCSDTGEPEINCRNCDLHAECIYDIDRLIFRCQCMAEYTGDGHICVRLGDCRRDPNVCDRNADCTPRGTDYICICRRGFRGSGQQCTPIGDHSSYLIYAQGMSIMQVPFNPSTDNRGHKVIHQSGMTAVGVDVDCYSRYLYWTDVSGKLISRSKLDGKDVEVLVKDLGSPEGVAVDWISGNMYWADSILDRIEVSRTDGTNRKTLFDKEMVNPRGVVVDPGRGVMFWSDWNRNSPKIEKANMDGTDRKILINDSLGLPNGLVLDFRTQLVCWADAGTMHIECSDYYGNGRQTLYALAAYPFSLAFANDVFYWTDWEMKSLSSLNKYSSEPNTPMELPPGGKGKLYGISAVKRDCPSVSNACVVNNGGCRFLCLPSSNGGRTCACPDDIPEQRCNEIALL